MDNNTILTGLSVLLVIIIIGLIIHQRSAPSIVGYSIKHAEEILLESGKPYRLGNKVGFLQPKKGDFNLLGKIAEQYVIPLENNKYSIDYKLYQIDIGEMDSALFPNKEIEHKKIEEHTKREIEEHAKREIELQRLTKEREEIIKRENAYREQAAREAQIEAAAREQAEREREQREREQAEREQAENSRKQKKSNSLQFMLPNKDSDVRYHGSKESFFW
jgi:hypothetical protein